MPRFPIVLSIIIIFQLIFFSNLAFSTEENTGNNQQFTLLYTADEHSALIPHSPAIDYHRDKPNKTLGGFKRLKTVISDIKLDSENPVLLVSAGDFLSGNPFSWLSIKGLTPELDLLQELGYDIVTLGNHEYDFGSDFIADHLQNAGYPDKSSETSLLATNTSIPDKHALSDRGIKKHKLIELANGISIGVIGILGEDAQHFIRDTDPLEFHHQINDAKENVETLINKGADIIISVNHSGLDENTKLANEVENIDIIVGGHTHKALTQPLTINDTLIVQPGSHLEYLGQLEIQYDDSQDQVTVLNEQKNVEHLIPIDDSIEPDQEIEAKISKYKQDLNQWLPGITDGKVNDIYQTVTTTDRVIERTPFYSETPLGNLITDSMRFYAETKTGEEVDFAFQINGQIRGDVLSGTREEVRGKVSFYDMARLAGMGRTFQNNPGHPLVSFYLTEQEISWMLEVSHVLAEYIGNPLFFQVSGLRYTYDPDKAIIGSVPITNWPIPSLNSIQSIEKYIGDGSQSDNTNVEKYKPLSEDDTQLYRVVTDLYITEFFPTDTLIGNTLFTPKNKHGEPITEFQDMIITSDGRPVTVWEGLVNYSIEQEDIGHYASNTNRRIFVSRVEGFFMSPLYVLGAIIILIMVVIGILIKKKLSHHH